MPDVIPPVAYGYLRVSDHKQGDTGLDAQRKVVTDLYETIKAEYPNLVIFEDAHISARIRHFNKRPQAAALLGSLKKGDCVIFPKMDRAFRNMLDMLKTLDVLEKLGVRLFSPDFGPFGTLDTTSITGKVVLFTIGFCAEMEGIRYSQRTHDFNAMCRKTGRSYGTAPYGYTNVKIPGKEHWWFQPNDDERAIMAWVYKAIKNGNSIRAVTDHLRKNKIRTRKNTPPDTKQIQRWVKQWAKIREMERKVFHLRGFRLRPWEFVTPDGVIMERFDKLDLKKEWEDARSRNAGVASAEDAAVGAVDQD